MIKPVPMARSGPSPSPETATPSSISALPSPLDLSLYAGDSFALTLTLTDDQNNPADLTGVVAAAQIRSKPGPNSPIVASFITAVSTNVVSLSFLGSETQTLGGGYVWDCQLTYPGGTITTIVAGKCSIPMDVTEP